MVGIFKLYIRRLRFQFGCFHFELLKLGILILFTIFFLPWRAHQWQTERVSMLRDLNISAAAGMNYIFAYCVIYCPYVKTLSFYRFETEQLFLLHLRRFRVKMWIFNGKIRIFIKIFKYLHLCFLILVRENQQEEFNIWRYKPTAICTLIWINTESNMGHV